jgi:hypothetical protein|tara:strand:+ start:2452 stop:3066 length:615 start_codon:yes stop_codon:yes gene_type:complete
MNEQKATGIVHSFTEQLEYSAKLSDEPSWVDFYRRLWPEMSACVRVDSPGKTQRDGIDRLIVLATGRQFTVDEKKRSEDHGDVLLEEWSVWKGEGHSQNKVGWALDPEKQCDFIAYAVIPARKCYLLPFELLRQAFMTHRSEWVREYRLPRPTRNRGYVTLNVGIPPGVLKVALWEQMHRKFGSCLELPEPMRVRSQIDFCWSE